MTKRENADKIRMLMILINRMTLDSVAAISKDRKIIISEFEKIYSAYGWFPFDHPIWPYHLHERIYDRLQSLVVHLIRVEFKKIEADFGAPDYFGRTIEDISEYLKLIKNIFSRHHSWVINDKSDIEKSFLSDIDKIRKLTNDIDEIILNTENGVVTKIDELMCTTSYLA